MTGMCIRWKEGWWMQSIRWMEELDGRPWIGFHRIGQRG